MKGMVKFMEGLKKGILVKNNVAVGMVGDKYFSNAPIGVIQAFSGTTAPHGYLLCNGASYKVADYPDLYAVIGNTYGGDTENFNVPNLVDKFIEGSTTSGTEKEAGLPNITGSFVPWAYQNSLNPSGAFSQSYTNVSAYDAYGANKGSQINFNASQSNSIYGNSDTVQPPALTMVYIIKAFHTNEGVDSGVSDDVINYIDNNTKVDVVLYDEFDIKNNDNIQNRLYLLGNILYGSLYLRFDEKHNPFAQGFDWVDIGDVPQITSSPALYNCISYAEILDDNDYAKGDVRIFEGKLQIRIRKQSTVIRENWYVFCNSICEKVRLAK